MTLAGIITLLTGLLQFPKEILRLIAVLKGTPEERHADLLAQMEKESKAFQDTGRPTWK